MNGPRNIRVADMEELFALTDFDESSPEPGDEHPHQIRRLARGRRHCFGDMEVSMSAPDLERISPATRNASIPTRHKKPEQLFTIGSVRSSQLWVGIEQSTAQVAAMTKLVLSATKNTG
jgi:hypothetical protein